MPQLEEPIIIFDGGEDGAGWARRPPGAHVYHYALNWDCRLPGVSTPAFTPMQIIQTTKLDHQGDPITVAFEWESGTTGVPIVIFAAGDGAAKALIFQIKDNAITLLNTRAVLPYTGGVLYRYDQDPTADANEEIAFFCNGATASTLTRMKKDGTIDQGATSAHTAKADGLFVVGSDLWRTNGYRVQKLPIDVDPGLEANWTNAYIPVGRPTYPVNAILSMGGSPAVVKGDGVFLWNPSDSTFFPAIQLDSPHPDNGKGASIDGRGRLYYPTVDGDLIVLTYGFQSQQKPFRGVTADRDTTGGVITAITTDQEFVYMAVEPGTRKTQDNMGLYVQSYNGSAYTNHTANVTDRAAATVADITALVVGNFLYIGANEPFAGVHFQLYSKRTTAIATATMATAYSNSGGFSTAYSKDGTDYLSHSGVIYVDDGVNYGDIYQAATTPWIATTVNSVSRFWLRITMPATMTGCQISEISLIPYRPPLVDGVAAATQSAYATQGPALAGAMTKLLVSRWQGENLVHHDTYLLHAANVHKLLVTRVGFSRKATTRSLLALTGQGFMHAIPIGHPSQQAMPVLGNYNSSFDYGDHMIKFSGAELPNGHMWSIEQLAIKMPYVESEDGLTLCYWWDDDAEQVRKAGELHGNPIVVEGIVGSGSVFHCALVYNDATQDYTPPHLYSVLVTHAKDLGVLGDRKDDLATPMTR